MYFRGRFMAGCWFTVSLCVTIAFDLFVRCWVADKALSLLLRGVWLTLLHIIGALLLRIGSWCSLCVSSVFVSSEFLGTFKLASAGPIVAAFVASIGLFVTWTLFWLRKALWNSTFDELQHCSGPLGWNQWCCCVDYEDSNLVDSASSHTLVSKIKPCMSKYKSLTLKLRTAHYISYSLFDSPLLLG